MAQIKISALTTGTPKGTDETPAVDTTDSTQSVSGTTKKYIRSAELNFYLGAQGLTTYSAVLVATTAALTSVYSNGSLGVGATLTNAGTQAALTIDGVLLVFGDRVLVKNQAAPAQNGIYTVTTIGTVSTNWVMTRATDYDQSADVIQYGVVLVNEGTVSSGLLYQETASGPFTIGTTSIVFSQFQPYLAIENTWANQTASSITMTTNTGYTANAGATLITFTLPTTSDVGDFVEINGKGSGLWTIAQAAGQQIFASPISTTAGTGGSLSSVNQYDCVRLRCITANTVWVVASQQNAGLNYA